MSITTKTLSALSLAALTLTAPAAVQAAEQTTEQNTGQTAEQNAERPPSPERGVTALMSIHNESYSAKHVEINNVKCLYDDGEQGSNISVFEGWYGVNERYPESGPGQYIEKKERGKCAKRSASFKVNFAKVGWVKIKSSHTKGYHVVKNTNKKHIDVDITPYSGYPHYTQQIEVSVD
ncbi:hypothetical protein ACOQFL_09715 [Actinopolyspora sp. H202]|uniref:hypothetical protein n=1 Tax=Actinopolyspora sp. H202 TaxID=1500456 RepID=UPI003EE76E7E